MGIFSKKKRSRAPVDTDMAWSDSPMYQEQQSARHNPLYEADLEMEPERNPVLEAFARTANHKQRTTGKGKGKSVMKDRHVGQEGGGEVHESANKVGSKTYQRNIGESGTNVGYFKPDQDNKISQEAVGAGIGSNDNDPHLSARAVASSRLDQALGVDVLSHDHFAKHGDQRGVVSAQAKGEALMTNQYAMMPEDRAAGYITALNNGEMTDEDMENFGNKVVRDEEGQATGLKQFQGSTYNEDVDLTNPNTLKGLADLEFMDFLTGQVDRHSGNIHIDTETGNVTGIDNDLAFGTDNDGLDLSQNFMGLPQHVDRRTANAFMAMSERQYLKVIGGSKKDYGRLSADEKEAAIERYQQMRDHIEGLSEGDEEGRDQLVDTWGEDVLAEATAHMREEDGSFQDLGGFELKNATTSYIGRAAWDLK